MPQDYNTPVTKEDLNQSLEKFKNELAPLFNPTYHFDSSYVQSVIHRPPVEQGHYKRIELDLGISRYEEEIYVGPRSFVSFAAVDSDLYIRFGNRHSDQVNAQLFNTIKLSPFDKIYVTNTAKAGNNAILIFGQAGLFEPVGAVSAGAATFASADMLSYLIRFEANQNLADDPLDVMSSIGNAFTLLEVMIHADQAISEDVSLIFCSKTSTDYDTTFYSGSFSTEQNFSFLPAQHKKFMEDDELRVKVTNNNAVGIVYLTAIMATRM